MDDAFFVKTINHMHASASKFPCIHVFHSGIKENIHSSACLKNDLTGIYAKQKPKQWLIHHKVYKLEIKLM